MKTKLDNVRQRRYIEMGLVSSLTHMFYVAKGMEDIRMVYNGTSSGLNRIAGTVAYMQPLNYWLRCRPTISRNIMSQIESGAVLASPALWLEDQVFGLQGSLSPEGLLAV